MAFTVSWLILVGIYLILTGVNVQACLLYRKAYLKMKKTLMIRSVWLLMVALFIENLYFAVTAIVQGFRHPLGLVLMHPLMWTVPKTFLLIALIHFVYASISPTRSLKK